MSPHRQFLLLACGSLACFLPAQASRLNRLRANLNIAPLPNEARTPNATSKFHFPNDIKVNLPAALHFSAKVNATAKQLPGVVTAGPITFQSYYNSYTTGRGVWKWSNAVDAYQRHFAPYAGHPLKLAEVGVQSGGSILMWQAVLGQQCHVYGLDINPKTQAFADAMSTIIIMDQGDPAMWANFFTNAVPAGQLNILVDDGSHEPHHMYTTLVHSFEKLSTGGMIAIEDIHGLSYVQSFFIPAAGYLGQKAAEGIVDSIHLYPFLLVAQRAGAIPSGVQSTLSFTGSSAVVSEFQQLWEAIPFHPGGHVILENPGWGPFLTAQGISNFFQVFGALAASTWHDIPTGCEHTAAAVCTVLVHNEPMQSMITGIHIYATRLIVEVAGAPVVLQAVRHGTEWISYA